jgi:hypothetical protein
MQSHQFFASKLQEQVFELKNEYAIKKSENTYDGAENPPKNI